MPVCTACRHAGCVLADAPTACVPCHRRYTPDGGGKPYIVAVKRLKLELFRSGHLQVAGSAPIPTVQLASCMDEGCNLSARVSA